MKRKINFIAIDPGLREMGVAHFEGTELTDYGVKSLRRPGNHSKRSLMLKKVITRMFDEKMPDVLVIEKNSFSGVKQNLPLMKAIGSIKVIAESGSIKIIEFAPNTIKKSVTGDGRATKKQVAHVVCYHYPELRAFNDSKKLWQERYYQNMFDAVACGLTYLNFYDKK
ncbi:MAG TPA: crossover junction endodeoxyribonuclease RuvC [candidate division Zixibacteria bacterium]|nr:crossover junction endodeoxyribonuclease RuvC [candidate division Zixibacteria bacterium]